MDAGLTDGRRLSCYEEERKHERERERESRREMQAEGAESFYHERRRQVVKMLLRLTLTKPQSFYLGLYMGLSSGALGVFSPLLRL
ncbi:hypothetical protein EYF80_002994 [Liparis tanakae]|uniref:Uncharacterized protein n=1 Tax=Liparis tanakae TaxID=230148 RepID=A0A4Z2JA50_9TELE|nr:hypothetical protein EYF80_002994 [Liparis tanakae]